MPKRSSPKQTIIYAKQEINGISVRPDSRAVMRKAIEGHPVEVRSGNDYINLYHVFERMQEADKSLLKLEMNRRQFGASRWLIWVLPIGAKPADVELEDDYDPKRGRYKRLAAQLAAGETITVDSKAEAIKARRAWQLYVPQEERAKLRSAVARVGKSAKFTVQVKARR